MAEQSWREALDIATKLGDSAWANRAEGELGLVAFLQGDISTSVIKLGRALQTAQSNGDVASVVRWLTLFGEGYSQLGRAEQALDYYDKALKAAAIVPELQFPAMTYLGKGDALVKIGRFDEAEQMLNEALAVATREGALGYEAELTFSLGLIANGRKQVDHSVDLLSRATDLARRAGGNRILAEIALELAKIQRDNNRLAEAEETLREGVEVARNMHEQILTPKLLAQLAEVRSSQQRYTDAADLLDEATDLVVSHDSAERPRGSNRVGDVDCRRGRCRLRAGCSRCSDRLVEPPAAGGRGLPHRRESNPPTAVGWAATPADR